MLNQVQHDIWDLKKYMAKLKLRGKDLEKIGYPRGSHITSLAMNIMHQHFKKTKKADALELLQQIIEQPEQFTKDIILGKIARQFLPEEEETAKGQPVRQNYDLQEPAAFPVYGKKFIDTNTKHQMEIAMKLPVTIQGALMPDAHVGYGLPIGGVLAVKNAVIPYGVGMDIGCRMCLSIYDTKPDFMHRNDYALKNHLKNNTCFGKDEFGDHKRDDAIFSRSEFKEIPTVKKLKDKAYRQIGTSGGGNHFVEFGTVVITALENDLGLPVGEYFALLSHSGSRGLGANIAQHYTNIARSTCLLPKEAQALAWLNLDNEAGMEYWLAMNLAGDYASACHHHIHRRLSKAIGHQPIATVENHHNFAWKEQLENGDEVIVHRKGATPAGKGVLGIIPGSMTAPAFIVRGKGNPLSINSASHGAGRAMSRSKAKSTFTMKAMRQNLKQHRVTLIGGGIDEAPMAYKSINQVMAAQQDLVEVLGTFIPKIVRMDKP